MTRIAESVVKGIIQKSQSNLARPRVRPETEQRLAATEQASARCYADMELMTERFNRLADQIAEEPSTGIVGSEVNFDDTSTVHHIDEMLRKTSAAIDTKDR